MATAQSTILPDHCKSGIFIELQVQPEALVALKQACAQSVAQCQALQARFPDAQLGLTIAFGHALWQQFGHATEGQDLKPFQPLGGGLAPATQADLLLHIQSMRQDVCFALALQIMDHFTPFSQVASETHGFRWVEERGLDGFVDGTENPKDAAIREVALIPEGQPDAGGSYVLIQKYRHDLKKWAAQKLEAQEACIGRTKESDEEIDDRLPDSHLGRVDLKENGKTLKIVRRSLPFGTVSGEHGLLFCAFSAKLYNIEQQLLSMFGDRDGKTDLLLKHLSTAVSGAYYFAPSQERLLAL